MWRRKRKQKMLGHWDLADAKSEHLMTCGRFAWHRFEVVPYGKISNKHAREESVVKPREARETRKIARFVVWTVQTHEQNGVTHQSPRPVPSPRGARVDCDSLLLPAAAEAKLEGRVEGIVCDSSGIRGL
jgi:hypothetical protein